MRIVDNFYRAAFLLILMVACNKNSHELPVTNGSLKMRSVAVEVSGFPVIDFLLEQTVLGTSTVRVGDTIWISIRNRSNFDLNSLGYILELCHRDSVDYDGCVTFYNQQFVQTLKPDSVSSRLHSVVNRNFDLESVEVIGGVISLNGKSNNSLAGCMALAMRPSKQTLLPQQRRFMDLHVDLFFQMERQHLDLKVR